MVPCPLRVCTILLIRYPATSSAKINLMALLISKDPFHPLTSLLHYTQCFSSKTGMAAYKPHDCSPGKSNQILVSELVYIIISVSNPAVQKQLKPKSNQMSKQPFTINYMYFHLTGKHVGQGTSGLQIILCQYQDSPIQSVKLHLQSVSKETQISRFCMSKLNNSLRNRSLITKLDA